MEATLGREADAVAFFAALAQKPYQYDFYQTLRRIECLFPEKPRWGSAPRPIDEPVRLGQEPSLAFAPSPLASFEASGGTPRLQVHLFGLMGPNGPLPIHLTEYARQRVRHAGDHTFSRFADVLQHRFIALFYRAWAQAQPHVSRDRPGDDRFATYLGAFIGLAPAAFRGRDTLSDLAKLFHVGTLIRHSRNADGLRAILEHFFRVPARIQEHVGQWLALGARERTRLAREGATLGAGAVLGLRVWDRQSKFRIHLGPLTRAQYESFLPAPRAHRLSQSSLPAGAEAGAVGAPGTRLKELVDWVRLYLGFELDWDVELGLRKNDVPSLTLGGGCRLGWTSWLGARRVDTDAQDLCLDAEAFVGRAGVPSHE